MEGQEGAPGVEGPPRADAPPAADADVPGHRRPIDASQKRRLWKFFDENYVGWRSSNLPREGVDEKLDKFITEIELVRTQVSRQLTSWKKAKNPAAVALTLDASREDLKQRIAARIGCLRDLTAAALADAKSMLKDVTAAADVVDRLLKDDEPVQGAADFGDRFFEDLIDALAMTSSKSAGGGMAASKAFFEQRLTIIDEQQTLWNQMHSVTDQLSREEKLTITRAFVAFEMAAFDGFKEAIADVDLPDLVVETVGPVHLKDARAPLVYYLAGWLLFTLFRLKSEDPFYAMYVSHNNISRGEAEEARGNDVLNMLRNEGSIWWFADCD